MTASWAKLAAALDEAELGEAAGRIKEQYLGIPSTSPVPPEVIAAASARECDTDCSSVCAGKYT